MANRKRLTDAALSLTVPAALAAAPMLLASPAAAQTSAADLRILSPRAGDTLESGSFALDVSFKSRTGFAITTAELWVDGTRWTRRDLDAPQLKNVLSFDVDSSTLSEGSHTFLIRVFDGQGAVAEKSVTLQLNGRTIPAAESSAGPEMKFVSPGNEKRVSGVVELQLDAKPRNGANPYVTFYVDKQFKTLKNYPPYSFNWDTTTVENGYHTIEAMGYLDANNASTTRRVRVYVDNAGGNTDVKTDIPDLSRARQQAPVSAVSATARPMTIPTRKNAAVTARTAASLVTRGVGGLAKVATPDVKSEVKTLTEQVKNSLQPVALDFLPTVTPSEVVNRAVRTPRPVKPTTVAVENTVAALRTSSTGIESAMTSVAPSISPLAPVTRSARTSHAAPAGNLTVRRAEGMPGLIAATPTQFAVKKVSLGVSLAAPAAPRVLSVPAASVRVSVAKPPMSLVPVRIPNTSKATPRAIVRPNLTRNFSPTLANLTEPKSLQVAFDGRQIAFDVRPRVEKGLPIAPFRQIFEHTGGQVMWVKHTQTVRAVNTDREIVISVGQKKAMVNGQMLNMDRKATLEHGRTIVPLSFVKDALDVNVKYDPATGHLDITSKN